MDERKRVQATRSEKTWKQKLGEAFVPEDVGNVGQYILTDWILPGIWDFVSNGINSIIPRRGGGPRSINQTGYRPPQARTANIQSQFSYDKVYDQKNQSQRDQLKIEYDNIKIMSRADAEMVLQEMRDMVDYAEMDGTSGCVAIGWFLDRCGIYPIPPNAWDWGWRNFNGAGTERYQDGYRIRLPKPISLKGR